MRNEAAAGGADRSVLRSGHGHPVTPSTQYPPTQPEVTGHTPRQVTLIVAEKLKRIW
jgi:hypothetical protein